MGNYLEKLPSFVDEIRSIRETIISNIVLIGQIPAPTFREQDRAKIFLERLADFQVDECTTDAYQNPIGIIRGTRRRLFVFIISAPIGIYSIKRI